MSKAKVLYIYVTAATSEVMKNLVLAGIPAALFDPRPYPVPSTSSFFLACRKNDDDAANNNNNSKKAKTTMANAVQAAVEDLNPLLGECPVVDSVDSVDDLLKDEATKATLASYSVVVASRLTPSQATQMAQIVTEAGNKFFLLDTFGMDGACLIDLGKNHMYRAEMGKDKLLDPVSLGAAHVPTQQILDIPLHESVNRFHKKFPPTAWARYRLLLAYAEQTKQWPEPSAAADFVQVVQQWCKDTGMPETMQQEQPCLQKEALEHLCQVSTAELAPCASVLGGLVGNEVIKALSGKGTPANNTVLLDGSSGKAWQFLLQPKSK